MTQMQHEENAVKNYNGHF